MNDFICFLSGFTLGSFATLCITFLVALAYSRMSGQKGPTGVTYTSDPLPFHIKDDHAEARIEREALRHPEDHDGIGR